MTEGESPMIGGLIVTHGELADELLAVTKKIVGEVDHIAAVSVGWHQNVEEARETIKKALGQVNRGRGVVILTDMFGGTPSNVALTFHDNDNCEIVTGANLPMVIKLASQKGKEDLQSLAEKIRDQGRSQISIAGKLLGK